MSFHKLDKARDKNFWSVRVSNDIRFIVHKTSDSLLLCYVDHLDKAYQSTERRKLEVHPKFNAVPLVKIRETVQEITPLRRRIGCRFYHKSFNQPNINLSFGRDIDLQSAA